MRNPFPTPVPTTGLIMMKPFAQVRPAYPKARPLGLVTVALAYFALGVSVGLVMKQRAAGRRWLRVLLVGGAAVAVGYLAWVARSLA